MVSEATIIIECFFGSLTIAINGASMIFGPATIAFNGFQWFWTIGQTMRWFRWIAMVYHRTIDADVREKLLIQNADQ